MYAYRVGLTFILFTFIEMGTSRSIPGHKFHTVLELESVEKILTEIFSKLLGFVRLAKNKLIRRNA